MRINKFLKERITRCKFYDTDCIKYDWRFGQNATGDEVRQWLRERPCDRCYYGLQIFIAKPIPGWEMECWQEPDQRIGNRPLVLRQEAVSERLGYFSVYYQLVVPVGGAGLYSTDPAYTVTVKFPFDPQAEPWEVTRSEIRGFADRRTMTYFATAYKESHRGGFEETYIALGTRILELGGDVDCLR